MHHFLRYLLAATVLLICRSGAAEIIELRVVALPDNQHMYYVDLLKQSMAAIGHDIKFSFIKGAPQPRELKMLEKDQLSLVWGVQTKRRDGTYAFVVNSLTNGLIGQRVLLVPTNQTNAYAGVTSLDDFRRLDKVGGFGVNWFDAEVWRFNRLPLYIKDGSWHDAFAMMASGTRGIDYLARGVNEISVEAAGRPGVAIEPHLLLTYERDMRFYLSPATARYKGLFEQALAQADRSGLKKELIAQYFAPGLKNLNLDKRLRLKLATPQE